VRSQFCFARLLFLFVLRLINFVINFLSLVSHFVSTPGIATLGMRSSTTSSGRPLTLRHGAFKLGALAMLWMGAGLRHHCGVAVDFMDVGPHQYTKISNNRVKLNIVQEKRLGRFLFV